MKKETALAMFQIAGLECRNVWELANQYWPKTPADMRGGGWERIEHYRLREDNPWWLIETQHGLVTIGPRKRVIEISWGTTPYRFIVTKDDVTKSETLVHAWTDLKATEYPTNFRELCDSHNAAGEKHAQSVHVP